MEIAARLLEGTRLRLAAPRSPPSFSPNPGRTETDKCLDVEIHSRSAVLMVAWRARLFGGALLGSAGTRFRPLFCFGDCRRDCCRCRCSCGWWTQSRIGVAWWSCVIWSRRFGESAVARMLWAGAAQWAGGRRAIGWRSSGQGLEDGLPVAVLRWGCSAGGSGAADQQCWRRRKGGGHAQGRWRGWWMRWGAGRRMCWP
jgi:hypothetical protein